MSTAAPVVSTAAFTLTLADVSMDVIRIATPVTAATSTVATAVSAVTANAIKTAKATAATPDPWWELSANLSYQAQSGGLTYREQFQGTYEATLKKAQGRITELATLKGQHDAVHLRVVSMSEGKT